LLELLVAAVFLSVVSVSLLVGFRDTGRRAKALVRLSNPVEQPGDDERSPGLIWHHLVNWIGTVVPASPKDLPLLKRRLVRAGFRDPEAARIFTGVKAVSALILGLAGVAIAVRYYLALENALFLIIGMAFAGYLLPMRYLMFRIKSAGFPYPPAPRSPELSGWAPRRCPRRAVSMGHC
jgi:tight adherence protein C